MRPLAECFNPRKLANWAKMPALVYLFFSWYNTLSSHGKCLYEQLYSMNWDICMLLLKWPPDRRILFNAVWIEDIPSGFRRIFFLVCQAIAVHGSRGLLVISILLLDHWGDNKSRPVVGSAAFYLNQWKQTNHYQLIGNAHFLFEPVKSRGRRTFNVLLGIHFFSLSLVD